MTLLRVLIVLQVVLLCFLVVLFSFGSSGESNFLDENKTIEIEKVNDVISEEQKNQLQEIRSNLTYNIISPPVNHTSQLECDFINQQRYSYLAQNSSESDDREFFFALDLDDAIHVLHTLFLAISESIMYLGPERCSLSVVGNPSRDGTWAYLEEVVYKMEALGVKCYLVKSVINSRQSRDRIGDLAKLRNEAIEPIFPSSNTSEIYSTKETIIIFSNDIGICPNDILELIHQHIFQKADMLCGMDFNFDDPVFRDTWIARTIQGELFFEIPQNGDWMFSKNLFWNDQKTRSHYDKRETFQVYSCWNGIVTLSPKPFVEDNVRFRGRLPGECDCGEPFYLAKDFWYNGYPRVGVVPTVNVAYNDADTKLTRTKYGSTDNIKSNETVPTEWTTTPPLSVRCIIPGFHGEFPVPWDDALPKKDKKNKNIEDVNN